MQEFPEIVRMSEADIGTALLKASHQRDGALRLVEIAMSDGEYDRRYDFFILKLMPKYAIVASLLSTKLRHVPLKDILAVADAKVFDRQQQFIAIIRRQYKHIKRINKL